MAAITLLTVLFCAATGYITHRRTGISLSSGVLGSMPGGLAQMMLLSEEIKDADLAVVTFMQMTRVLAVIFIVPFVATYGMAHLPATAAPFPPAGAAFPWSPAAVLPALLLPPLGAWLAHRLKVPIPFLLGSICVTAVAMLVGYQAPPVPRVLMQTAQLLFGVYMGRAIALESLRQLGRVLPYAIGGAVALVAFSYLLSWGLTLVAPATLLAAFLGTAPGGITEMCIVALTLGADVAFVLAFQLFRLFSILLVLPPLLRQRFRR
jgi:membrane AbrB-like protein